MYTRNTMEDMIRRRSHNKLTLIGDHPSKFERYENYLVFVHAERLNQKYERWYFDFDKRWNRIYSMRIAIVTIIEIKFSESYWYDTQFYFLSTIFFISVKVIKEKYGHVFHYGFSSINCFEIGRWKSRENVSMSN